MIIAPEIVARTQFAFTVSFHIIFPTISIGLASFLAIVEGLWLKTKDQIFLQIYKFWLSIFAMAFGVGVVTGIVLSFEFDSKEFQTIANPSADRGCILSDATGEHQCLNSSQGRRE